MTNVRVLHAGALLAFFAVAAGAQPTDAEDADDADEGGGKYIETVIVTGERGEVNVLDRPMTVTGFNARSSQH